ncbi:MAG: GNAT family N-acetyltransferase [Bacteroidia bacterium]|nr:GNAT family N-acetyltransferase [Bacteroidia bacterium]NNJ55585.1 GNAT family N-acetyltransferase [Bacteroidia bacterium]
MESKRIIFRERTKTLMETLIVSSLKEQMEFLGYSEPILTQTEVEKTKQSLRKIEQIVWFDLIEKQSNKVIGSCGFHNWVKEHKRAEIGYYLHPEFRSKGYMVEATKNVIEYGFSEMELIRIEAFLDPENGPSLGIMSHFNFSKEGLMREHYISNENVYDSVVFSLLKREWKSSS